MSRIHHFIVWNRGLRRSVLIAQLLTVVGVALLGSLAVYNWADNYFHYSSPAPVATGSTGQANGSGSTSVRHSRGTGAGNSELLPGPIPTIQPLSPTCKLPSLDGSQPGFIIFQGSLQRLETSMANDYQMSQDQINQLVEQAFDTPSTLFIFDASKSDQASILPHATQTMDFNSEADLAAAFAGTGSAKNKTTIQPQTQAILYDNENFSDGSTPKNEIQDPAYYTAEAANIVHSHCMIFANSPSQDLMSALDPAHNGTGTPSNVKFENMMADGYLGRAAAADVVDVQLQNYKSDQGSAQFASDAQTAYNLIKAANPASRLYVGISTFPTKTAVPPQVLINEYDQTKSFASGYWLNVPTWTTSNYTGSHPEVGVCFLLSVFQGSDCASSSQWDDY